MAPSKSFGMCMYKIIFHVCLFCVLVCSSCHSQQNGTAELTSKYEFRAVWIATVDNIDWPRKGQYNSEEQKRDFIRILDEHKRSNMNAVMVQVRDACDAYYAKGLEPWSEFLTGTQGKFPSPFYDPLDFMIQEAHARNLEFHAWLNLNRATFKRAGSIMPEHISMTKPEWMIQYDGQKVLNFSIPEVRDYIVQVVVEIVKNYDVDGIHFDDYFYPYPVPGQQLNDFDTFRKYGAGYRNIEDWRRSNTDILIQQIGEAIKRIKPYVKYGISPFGVWQNYSPIVKVGSKTQAGTTSYQTLYADTRKWIEKGWVDYIVPQVYFERSHPKVPYKVLIDWWSQHTYGRHLYIGHGIYKIKSGWNNAEATSQLRLDRNNVNIQGGMFFSSKCLTENYGGIQDSLRASLYHYPAIIPPMRWKDSIAPKPPQRVIALKDNGMNKLVWQPGEKASDGNENVYFAVYRFEKAEKINLYRVDKILYVGRDVSFLDYTSERARGYVYAVTSFDRLHNESTPTMVVVNYGETR